jgi:hypothetical protein
MSLKDISDRELEIELEHRKIDHYLESLRLGAVSNIKEGLTEGDGIIADRSTEHAYPDKLRHFLIYDAYGPKNDPYKLLATASISPDTLIMGKSGSFSVSVRAFRDDILIVIESDDIPKMEKTSDDYRITFPLRG